DAPCGAGLPQLGRPGLPESANVVAGSSLAALLLAGAAAAPSRYRGLFRSLSRGGVGGGTPPTDAGARGVGSRPVPLARKGDLPPVRRGRSPPRASGGHRWG